MIIIKATAKCDGRFPYYGANGECEETCDIELHLIERTNYIGDDEELETIAFEPTYPFDSGWYVCGSGRATCPKCRKGPSSKKE
jgi:hypothetical protein